MQSETVPLLTASELDESSALVHDVTIEKSISIDAVGKKTKRSVRPYAQRLTGSPPLKKVATALIHATEGHV